MNMTAKKAQVILARYQELRNLAEQFTGHWNIRFDDAGNIEHEVNTACHCHPEYEWQIDKTAEQFGEWLNQRAVEAATV